MTVAELADEGDRYGSVGKFRRRRGRKAGLKDVRWRMIEEGVCFHGGENEGTEELHSAVCRAELHSARSSEGVGTGAQTEASAGVRGPRPEVWGNVREEARRRGGHERVV
ncbi:hypothetical protein TRIUR3_12769 [Triticum urartu]|uniref:Uncharacterized protein n=1 Tax=Triticum urartu TaxID=4572 RepID=M8B3I0_TRIUA|nr:hypothetical protein TRIUR3_12769 [Triticum urartu]